MNTISFIVPTVGRPSLGAAIRSIEPWVGDEVIVVKLDPPGGHWGNEERQEGMRRATRGWLAFLDDDNAYVAGHRELMELAIRSAPERPTLFRVRFADGEVIWRRRWVKNGNVDVHMVLVPNRPEMLHDWRSKQRFADFHFVNQWRWPAKQIQWREEVIATMGHGIKRRAV